MTPQMKSKTEFDKKLLLVGGSLPVVALRRKAEQKKAAEKKAAEEKRIATLGAVHAA